MCENLKAAVCLQSDEESGINMTGNRKTTFSKMKKVLSKCLRNLAGGKTGLKVFFFLVKSEKKVGGWVGMRNSACKCNWPHTPCFSFRNLAVRCKTRAELEGEALTSPVKMFPPTFTFAASSDDPESSESWELTMELLLLWAGRAAQVCIWPVGRTSIRSEDGAAPGQPGETVSLTAVLLSLDIHSSASQKQFRASAILISMLWLWFDQHQPDLFSWDIFNFTTERQQWRCGWKIECQTITTTKLKV